MARRGAAGRGVAWLWGPPLISTDFMLNGFYKTRHGVAGLGAAGRGWAWLGGARPGEAGLGWAWLWGPPLIFITLGGYNG